MTLRIGGDTLHRPSLTERMMLDLPTLLAFAASPGPDNVTIVARTLFHGAVSGITVAQIAFVLKQADAPRHLLKRIDDC